MNVEKWNGQVFTPANIIPVYISKTLVGYMLWHSCERVAWIRKNNVIVVFEDMFYSGHEFCDIREMTVKYTTFQMQSDAVFILDDRCPIPFPIFEPSSYTYQWNEHNETWNLKNKTPWIISSSWAVNIHQRKRHHKREHNFIIRCVESPLHL